MYAYVQFLVDKVKAIVPVGDIKNFNTNNFDMDRAYEVFWKSPNSEGTGYWYAVILLVAETEEQIEQRKKRVKLPAPKRLEELLAMTLDDEVKKSDVDIESRRTNKLKKEENSLLKRKNDHLQELNMSLQTKLLSLLSANGSLGENPLPSQKLPELVDTTAKDNLPKETGSLGQNHLPTRKLPVLVSTVKYNLSRGETNEGGSLLKPNSIFMPDILETERVEVPYVLKESNPPLYEHPESELHLHNIDHLMKWENEQMELAPGIFIKKDEWGKIVRNKNMNSSRFTRNLAVSLWGSDTLKERSVTGTACKRFLKEGIEAKKALTPLKVDAVQNGLRFWLKEQERDEQEISKVSSITSVRKMLADKIMDVVKQSKKK